MRVYLPRELSSEAGAQKHVALIRDYWWSRGHVTVDAWPVPLGEDASKKPLWSVQSNLVNGLPS